jgi:hypothetical protein
MSSLRNFLGGSPLAVGLKLVFLSLLVGAALATIGLTPVTLIELLIEWVQSLFELGFDALADLGRWALYGAVIVVPVWLSLRLVRTR